MLSLFYLLLRRGTRSPWRIFGLRVPVWRIDVITALLADWSPVPHGSIRPFSTWSLAFSSKKGRHWAENGERKSSCTANHGFPALVPANWVRPCPARGLATATFVQGAFGTGLVPRRCGEWSRAEKSLLPLLKNNLILTQLYVLMF